MTRTGTDDNAVLLRGQTEVLERIAAGGPLADVLAQVVTTLEALLPDCLCSIVLLDAESQTLHHGAAPSLPGGYSASIDGLRIGARAGSCGTAAYLGTPVVVADIDTDPLWDDYRELAGRYDLRACWSTPIRGRDGVLGTFAVYHTGPHEPSDRERRLVGRLTHLASVAIDHDRLFGALAESEEAFRRAFDDNVVGMALTGLDRDITRANPALHDLLGRSGDALVGAALDTVFARTRAASGDPGRRAEQYEATARHTGGDRLDLVVTVSPVRDADGAPVRLSVAVLDVTGRRAAERDRRARQEAELARAAAETASRAKSDFVAALGHELRTPLQAITGFAELLGGLDLPPERRTAALGHIQSAAAHILAMVDDVLDVARIEAGALSLHVTDEDLGEVVGEVVALLDPLARAHRVTVRRSGRAALVRVDQRRLTQVLLNVIGNAIRYNHPAGEVAVALSTSGPDEALVTVHDTGPGIPAEHLDRLFTPFDRLGVDGDEGVGLGLPLARGLATAMGGRLAVTSTAGAGTTVVVAARRVH